MSNCSSQTHYPLSRTKVGNLLWSTVMIYKALHKSRLSTYWNYDTPPNKVPGHSKLMVI